jgi:VWFA-related protein
MRLSAVVAATLLATAAVAAVAQQKTADLPVFGVDSVVVAVPVFVLDKNGKAVPGLTREAFVVEDDGKAVPIVAFQAVDAAAPPFAPGSPALTRAAARRQFLFLFDLSFSTPDGVRRARDAALQSLDQSLAPGDLAAAATFGAAGVKLLVGFTSDREQLRRAFVDLTGAQGERRPDPLNLAFDLGLRLGESGGLSRTYEPGEAVGQNDTLDDQLRAQLVLQDQVERQIYTARVQDFISGLQGLSQMLDSIQGRKQVLLLSAGFDPGVLGGAEGAQRVESSRAVTEGRLWEVDSSTYFGDARATGAMGTLFDALAASDVVIHALDVTGLGAGAGAESGRGGASARGSESLAQLALNSGGRFVKSTNDAAAALRDILDASRHYYVVAFEPRAGGKKPGQLRRLKVKVAGDGLKVSHRAGWTLPAAGARDAGRSRLATADAIAKGLEGGAFDLQALAVPYRGEAGAALPVVLAIGGEGLVAADAKGALELELFGYAFGADGRIADTFAAAPAFDLGQVGPAIRARGIEVLTSFRVAPGPHELHFLVRDRRTGRAGGLRVAVEVPDLEGPAPALSAPLLVDDPRARVVLPAASMGQPKLEIPFRLGDTAFVPDVAGVLRNGRAREVALLAWKAPALGFAEIGARLVGAAGEAHAVPVRLARSFRDADGFARLVLALTPQGVPAGDYALEISFRDPDTGETTLTSGHARVE